jgi:hypothetical protein
MAKTQQLQEEEVIHLKSWRKMKQDIGREIHSQKVCARKLRLQGDTSGTAGHLEDCSRTTTSTAGNNKEEKPLRRNFGRKSVRAFPPAFH